MTAVSHANASNPAVKRIMREYAEFQQSYAQLRRRPAASSASPPPPLDVVAHPLDDNLFEWHFTLRGAAGSPYAAGLYHGRILLPSTYPFRPPDVVLLTPSGRFEVGKKICLSISSFHPANWQPSWSIRTVLTALMAFFPTPAAGAIGSLDYTDAEKVALAGKSGAYTCPQCKQSNADIMRSHERVEQQMHSSDDGEEDEEEQPVGEAASVAAVAVVDAALPSAPLPLPSAASPSDSALASGVAASPSAPSASQPLLTSSTTSGAPFAARPGVVLSSFSSASPGPSTLHTLTSPSAATSRMPSSSLPSTTDASASAPSSSAAPASSASSAVPAPLPPPPASSARSPVVILPPGKLSRMTVFLSLLIVVILLRRLLSHLLAQQQQQHHISLFHAR